MAPLFSAILIGVEARRERGGSIKLKKKKGRHPPSPHWKERKEEK